MDPKHILRTAALLAVLLTAASCIYPFHPDVVSSDRRLVIEGDIHLGSTSTFLFSRVYPIGVSETIKMPAFTGYIEAENGSKLLPLDEADLSGVDQQFLSSVSALTFDTRDLDEQTRYRVHFETPSTGEVFETEWIEPCSAPVIDDLTYILDSDRQELNVALSMHCHGHHFFRWTYDETWEYTALLYATHYWDPERARATRRPREGLVQFPTNENTYYCWKEYYSPEIRIFTTVEQTEDRFVDLEFHRVPARDQRLSVLYRLDVRLEAMTEEAYLYWKNIEDNSQNQGTIFSPTPSQMAGNIRCLSDPDLPVLGYIGAARQAEARMYYDNSLEHFCTLRQFVREDDVEEITPGQFQEYYEKNGFLPQTINVEPMTGDEVYVWASRTCVDCRLSGGTKNKPAGWPNNHH